MSLLPSILILGIVALIALQLAGSRESAAEREGDRAAASRALAMATAVQFVHFSEEWATGFHVRFPALLGLDPIPLPVFLLFNFAWIAIWITAIPLLRASRTFGFFAAWFLALAGILNGIAHPLLAVATSGYFPGLMTSPFIGLAGVYLWRKLDLATQRP